MNSGELKHKIIIQEFRLETDTSEEETWVEFKKLSAKTKNLFGSEFWAAQAVNAEGTVKFTVRYSSGKDITTVMRVIFQSIIFEIIALDDIEYKHEWIEIKAKCVG